VRAVVRTLTGHRSNCISVDFHPFGEFFASGSLDTNLKIWDIRRKGCIHTYKGHTRGINAIKFSPDGRWVVSGGEDNVVKVSTFQHNTSLFTNSSFFTFIDCGEFCGSKWGLLACSCCSKFPNIRYTIFNKQG